MDETLRHVKKKNTSIRAKAKPSGYLGWPLLQYDYLEMHAVPPDQYEPECKFSNINFVFKLMNSFNTGFFLSHITCSRCFARHGDIEDPSLEGNVPKIYKR